MDYRELLKELGQVNLCTYYLLPLTGLTKFSFGEGLFINSYVDRKHYLVVVHVPDLMLVPSEVRRAANYRREWTNDRGGYLAFNIPDRFRMAVHLYGEGLYSMFSEPVKDIIRERCGLPYKVVGGDGSVSTDIRLLALEKDRTAARIFWEQELKCVLDDNQEVLDKPSIRSYMEVTEG